MLFIDLAFLVLICTCIFPLKMSVESFFRGSLKVKNSEFILIGLLKVIKDKIEKNTPNEKIFISRERHFQCLSSTLSYLNSSKEDKNIDLFAEDIRQALKSLSSLFGSVDIEDILDIIFSDFCIGK